MPIVFAVYLMAKRAALHPIIYEKELDMSQNPEQLLSQVTQDISPEEVQKTHDANKRVDAAYGSDGRGLIVVVEVMQPAKPDDLY
jgi:hypothetical protein